MHRRPLGSALICILVVTSAGCDPTGPGKGALPPVDSTFAASCAEAGPSHSGSASGHWSAIEGPHHVTGTITISDSLDIAHGALVCLAEDATILVSPAGRLTARGQADAPVVFTAEDSMRAWGGVYHGNAGQYQVVLSLAHTRIEHARVGLEGDGLVEVDSSVIRAIEGPAVRVRYSSGSADTRLRGTRIEDACRAEGMGSIEIDVFGRVELEDVIIRDSGCRGIWTNYKSSMSLTRVRIEGSAGIGLEHERVGGSVDIHVDGLRINGGDDRPARISGENLLNILRSVPLDSLAGNAIDRVAVFGSIRHQDITVPPGLGLELGWPGPEHDHTRVYFWDMTLTLEPGSHLLLNAAEFPEGFRLRAEGTAEAPIRIGAPPGDWDGITVKGESTDTTRLSHVHLTRVHLAAREAHTVVISDARVDSARIRLASPGSSILRSRFVDPASSDIFAGWSALDLAAAGTSAEDVTIEGSVGHGVLVTAPDARIDGCDITGSAADAIHVTGAATGVSVHNCSITGNAWLGLRNNAGALVDAEQNWWGDPAGPLGPAGAGVSGNVDFDPWLTAPANNGSGTAAGTPGG